MDDKGKYKSPHCKNVLIKMYNKGKKFYEPYAAIATEPSKYDLHSTQGQMSHISTPMTLINK